MPRPIWSGTITFGLVAVPVKLYPAVREKDVRFHLLHDKDGARLQQKRVCSEDQEEVSWEHVVRGYEVSKDRYVVLTDEELRALDPKGGRSIDVEQFVDQSEIDPILYERSYHVVPDKGGQKAYALLVRAMAESGKVAIGRLVMRTKQYLAAIRPRGGALTLATMLHHDEVVPAETLDELKERTGKAGEKELAMAQELISKLASPFEPERFKDEHREKVLALIEKKAEGKEVVAQPRVEKAGKVLDLMAALKESLAATKPSPRRAARPEKKPRKRRRAA